MSRRYMKIIRSIWMGALVFGVMTSPVSAAKPKDPAKEALRRMQIEMMKMQDEKAAMSVELEAVKKKSDAVEVASKQVEHRRAMLDRGMVGLHQEKTVLVEKVATLEKKLAEEQKLLAEEKKSLIEAHLHLDQEAEKKKSLEQNLSTRSKALEVCETKNKMLYQYHVDLINRAQNRGSLSVLLEKEPVLGFKRVQIENLMEEYRDKIDDQKVQTSVVPQAEGK